MRGYPSISPFLGPSSRKLSPPNKDNIIRRFLKRSGNVLIDSIANRDATVLTPGDSVTILSTLSFSDLSGVTITSYSGDQILSISGNDIVASGDGFVHSLLLSDGTFIPFLYNGYDVSGNGNHATPSNIARDYATNGSTHYFDYGAVARNPEQIINGNFDGNADGWTLANWFYNDNGIEISATTGSIQQVDVNTIGRLTKYTIKASGIDALTVFALGSYSGNSLAERTIINGTHEYILTPTSDVLSIIQATTGSARIEFISAEYVTPSYIPNDLNGQPLFPLVAGDTFISGTSFINATPWMVDMSRPNGAEGEEVVDGDFSNPNSFTLHTGTNISGGKLIYDGTQATVLVTQSGVGTISKKFIVSVDNFTKTQGNCQVVGGSSASVNGRFDLPTGSGVKVIQWDGNDDLLYINGISNLIGSIDNISVKLATPEILFFDKSDVTIWKQSVRDSVYYNVDNPFEWHVSELTQEFIYENIQDAEKYKWWIRLISNQYKDLFFYTTALTGDNICKVKKYVTIGETITDLTGMESDILCNNDILKE